LELFDSSATSSNPLTIELDLICQFNEFDYFWAIFAVVNKYRFTKALPIVGHSYLKQIMLHKHDNSTEHCVIDLNDRDDIEQFVFELNKVERRIMSFQGFNHLTGIEWWNKVGNFVFP